MEIHELSIVRIYIDGVWMPMLLAVHQSYFSMSRYFDTDEQWQEWQETYDLIDCDDCKYATEYFGVFYERFPEFDDCGMAVVQLPLSRLPSFQWGL